MRIGLVLKVEIYKLKKKLLNDENRKLLELNETSLTAFIVPTLNSKTIK